MEKKIFCDKCKHLEKYVNCKMVSLNILGFCKNEIEFEIKTPCGRYNEIACPACYSILYKNSHTEFGFMRDYKPRKMLGLKELFFMILS